MQKLNGFALGYAGAIVAASIMLLLGILGNLAIYQQGVIMMQQWHIFFTLSAVGILAGIAEAAIVSFALVYAVALVYNKHVGNEG